MSFVGIIINPASGKDVRRLAAHATTFNNHQKVSVVQRVLVALCASGVTRIEIMPDPFGIDRRALGGLSTHPEIAAAASLIEMDWEGTAADTACAAGRLRAVGAGCIVVLGGDGTCRMAVMDCGEVPLLPLSTGTNNVVPSFVDGTITGLAAGIVAAHSGEGRGRFCYRHKRLLVSINGRPTDEALVDVAVLEEWFAGTRAVWKADSLRCLFVTQAQPLNIGLSSVIGMVRSIDAAAPNGAAAAVGPNGIRVLAPIAPEALASVSLDPVHTLHPGVPFPFQAGAPGVLALDGEREIALRPGDCVEITLALDDPWLVEVERTLRCRSQQDATVG